MRKLIAAMNMTLDGICDHTVMNADDEIHQHYTELLRRGDTLLYGRITYQLMESFWPNLVKNPSGNKALDDFAVAMENISKIVFSHTLKDVEWESARVANRSLEEEILDLKRQPGRDIFVGSPSLIVQATNLKLVDEYQISVQPAIEGKGLALFKNIKERTDLKLLKTKTFECGAVTFYYETVRSN